MAVSVSVCPISKHTARVLLVCFLAIFFGALTAGVAF